MTDSHDLLESGSFEQHYATLARIAAELDTGEADLDRVLPLLQEAQTAYAACTSRLAAVRELLALLDDEEDGDEDEDDMEDEQEEDEEDF